PGTRRGGDAQARPGAPDVHPREPDTRTPLVTLLVTLLATPLTRRTRHRDIFTPVARNRTWRLSCAPPVASHARAGQAGSTSVERRREEPACRPPGPARAA